MRRPRRWLAALGLALAVGGLLTACAGLSGGGTGSPPAYYSGPPYWNPDRGTFIDPLTGQPVGGGGR